MNYYAVIINDGREYSVWGIYSTEEQANKEASIAGGLYNTRVERV